MNARPIYLVAPPGAVRDRCLAALPGASVVEAPLRPGSLACEPPGVVLVEPGGVCAEELARAAESLRGADGWTLCSATPRGDGDVEVRTVSFGNRHTLEDVRRFAGDDPAKGDLLDLYGVLTEVAKARHDLNNPLTSALAEVQILLMEAGDAAAEESLLTIQEQLRRLRDRLLATRHLRPAAAGV